MKTGKLRYTIVALFCVALAAQVAADNSVITYQGRVQSEGTNFTGTGSFKFALITSSKNKARQATAVATVLNGVVTAITVTDGGQGYIDVPKVKITAFGGSGALATAVVSGGEVVSITVNSGGANYTGRTSIYIESPPDMIYNTYWSNDGTSVEGSEPVDAVAVAVENGLFKVGLGDTGLAYMQSLDSALFSEPDLQLSIWFDDGTNGFSALSPAQPLTAAPYALNASTVSGPVPASQLTGNIYADDANLLDGFDSGTFRNASSMNAGTLDTDRFDAYQDLSEDGKLDVSAAGDLLTRSQADSRYGVHGNLSGLTADDHPQYLRSNASDTYNIYGQNLSLRFEGDTDEDLLFIDGSTDRVGIGTDAPEEKLHVNGKLRVESTTHLYGSLYVEDDIIARDSSGLTLRPTSWVYGIRIDNEGDVGIGTSAPADHQLYVLGDASGVSGSAAYIKNNHSTGIALATENSSSDVNTLLAQHGAGDFLYCDSFDDSGWQRPIRLRHDGTVECTVLHITGGSDVAEPFPTPANETIVPGSVLCIDPAHPGGLRLADKPYDRCVAGIVSGAGDVNPGILLTQSGTLADGTCPVALSGRTYVLADATNGAIAPGDMLTTSSTKGHAMRVDDYSQAQGAVLGKAMTSLDSGRGLVLVLVALH